MNTAPDDLIIFIWPDLQVVYPRKVTIFGTKSTFKIYRFTVKFLAVKQ
jgi:hypothetical protein